MAKKRATIDAAALKAEFLGVDTPNKKEASAETTSKGIDAAALRAEYLPIDTKESDTEESGVAPLLRATMRSAYNRGSALDGIEATDAASQSVVNMANAARMRGYMEAEQKRLKPLYDYLASEGDAGEGAKPIDFTQSTLGKSIEEMMPKSQYIPRGKELLDIMDKNSGVTDKSELYSDTDRLRAMYMLNPELAKGSLFVKWNEHYPAPTTPIMTPSEDGLYHIGENTYTHEDMVNVLSGYMPVAQHKRLLNYNKHYRDDYARSLGYKNWDEAYTGQLDALLAELDRMEESVSSSTTYTSYGSDAFTPTNAKVLRHKTEGKRMTGDELYAINQARDHINMLKTNAEYNGDDVTWGEVVRAFVDPIGTYKLGRKMLGAGDVVSAGFQEKYDTIDMISMDIASIGHMKRLGNILEKVNSGESLTDAERTLYKTWDIMEKADALHNDFYNGKSPVLSTFAGGIGESVEKMPEFALSMATTGGISFGGKVALKESFKQGFKAGMKQTLKHSAIKAGEYATRSSISAAVSPMTYATYLDRRTQQYHIDEKGDIVKDERPWAKDLGIAYVESFNEYFSEYLGYGASRLIDISPTAVGSLFGIDKAAGKQGLRNIIEYINAALPTERMRSTALYMGVSGTMTETPSEILGDFMNSVMLAPFSDEHGFEQFTDKEYYLEMFLSTSLFGGAMGAFNTPAQLKNVYDVNKLISRREASLDKIEDVELRNNLKSVMSLESMEEMSQAMVDLHIEKLSPDQAAAVIEYLSTATLIKAKTGEKMEGGRMLYMADYINELQKITYKGKDGSLPSKDVIRVVDKNGRELYVVAGDVNNTSDVSMLKCKTYDAENRKWVDVAVPASEVMGMKRESVEQVISAEYERMFGTEIMAERLKEIEGARKSMEDPSAEVVRGHYLRNGLKVYDTGAEVSLADGRTAVVESMLADGSYLVRSVNPTTQTEELYEVPFMQVLQPEASLAEAQKQMFAKNIESATQSIERAEVTEQSAEAGVAEEEDVDADMEDVVEQAQEMPKPVPTREDGSVDFSAIEDPKMFATEYTKKMGGEEKAKASVAKMAANARAEASQLREKSDKMTDPNEVVDAVAKADAMDARADFYDKVLAEYALQEEVQPETYKAGDVVEYDGRIAEVVGEENEGVVIADAQGRMTIVDPTTLSRVAEAPAEENAVEPIEDADDKLIEETEAGIVQNVFGKMLDARTANVIDAMAKALGVKVAFVESVTTQAGTRANADIKGNVVRIAWAQRKKAISFLAGHEFTHRMKDMSPEAYAEFTKSVKEYLGETEWQRRMNAQRATYESHNRRAEAEGKPLLSYEDTLLEEEVVADFVGDMVENHHAFEHYVQKQSQKPSLLQAIKKVLSAIGRFFRRMGARTEAQRMKEMIAHLDTFINKAREEAKEKGVQESGKARSSLIGEVGAEALDRAEEATTRLDNLAVAREMETAGKDAKSIRMATGWERGADGLWRYEIMDAKVNLYEGDENTIRKKIEVAEEEEKDFMQQSKADTKELRERTNSYLAEMRDKYGVAEGEETDAMTEEEIAQLQSLTNKEIEFEDYKERRRNELYNRRMALEALLGYVRVKNTDASAMVLSTRLGHILQGNDAEMLFTAYPSLRDIEVQFVTDIRDGAFAAYATKGGYKRIELNAKKTPVDMIAPYILHEVQHAIQDIEGFAGGGNLSSLQSDENVTAKEAYDYYRKIAGEVEARNVSARINMTPEERRATLLSETEDVAREDQIFLREGAEMAMAKNVGLPKEEYAKLASTIMTRQHTYGRPPFDYAFTDGSFYVYDYLGDGDSIINFAMPIVGNEDLIQNITNSIDNGTITDTRGLDLYAENLQGKQRVNYRRFADAFKKRHGNRGYGVTFRGDSASNGGTYFEDSKRIGGDATTRGTSGNIDESANQELTTRFSLITPEMNASYLDAVERGDMETAQRMVMEAAEKAGYINDESWRMNHRAPRKDEENSNPFNTEKIVPEDFWEHPEWYTNIRHSSETRESYYAMKPAIDKYKRLMAEGKTEEADNVTITMYRGVDKTANKREASFRNGDWITPSRSYALLSAPYGKARVISQEVKLKDIWWDGNSINEWGYDDGANYGYRDTKNNRKLLDPVTYDDAGNIIPLSERFNPRKEDIRYSLQVSDEELAEIEAERQSIIETAKANGTYLKAPNGKDTNLTPEQWVNVRTSRFKKWFGDWENDPRNASKIVDENGEPMVMIHGSQNTFTIFRRGQSDSGGSGRGIYFARAPKDASNYEYGGPDGNKYFVFLNVRNLYDFNLTLAGKNYKAREFAIDDKKRRIPDEVMKAIIGASSYDEFIKNTQNSRFNSYKATIENISETTFNKIHSFFDGKGKFSSTPVVKKRLFRKDDAYLALNHDFIGEIVVRDPNQIKSATDNVGTYSAANDDIRYSLITPEMDASYLDAVNRGDMETAQQMVMEAAKLAMPNTKVVDEDGNPKVVYHGTPNNFNAFSKEMFGTSTDRGIWGNGFYFSDSEQYAKTYEKRGDKQGRTLTVFLNIENPLFISLRNGGNEGAMYFHELMEKHFTDDIYEDATRTDELMSVAQERLTADIVAKGYDGIVVEYTNHIDTEYVAFEPNQIKSADPVTYDDAGNVIPLSERFNPKKEDIRYSLIGEIGAANIEDYGRYGSPMFNLEMARELEAMGKSAKKIRLATNWERGADDKWRYEIMDGTYNHPTDDDVAGKKYRLADILDNANLYKAYPDLADMTVIYDPSIDGWGAYNGERIALNPSRTNEEIASTLLHEVQHAIQHREMFARGGNESMMEKRIAKEVEKLQQEFNALGEEFRNTSNAHLLRKGYLLYQGLRILAKQGKLDGSEYEAYRRLAGEVEARNVQKRMGMSEDERLNTMLQATEDVARKDQEVLFREVGVDADAQEAGYRYSIEEIIDTPSDEEYKQQMLELAQQMERDAEERNLDKAQEIADVTGWVHLADDEWKYYGDVDITEDAKESTRVRRWLESKAAVKKARTRKMYDDLLKEQKKVVKELESESKARRSNASYAKAVDAILQGQAHEALPIEDQILVDVALGQKLRWEDEQGGSRRGLKTELGLRSTTAEGMAEVTGGNTYIEDYVAAVVERNNGYENGIDDNDVRNAVIEVFGSYPSRKAALAELSRRYPDTALNEATEAIAQLEQERDEALAQIDADLRSELADAEANPSQYERAYEEEGTWNLQFDIYTGALRKARNEVSRMERDMQKAKLTQREKTAAMRTVKRAVVDMLKGDLGRYTRKRDIQALMDAVNEAQTLYAMQRAIDKAMLAINELRLRKETARMNNLLKMRISSHDSAIDPRIFFANMMKGSKNVDSAVRRLMNDYWRGVNSSGIDVAKGVDGDTARVLQFIRMHSDLTAELGKAPTEGDILKRCEAWRKELRGEAVETSIFSDTERKEIETLSPEVRERMADAVSVIEGYLMVQYQLQNMDEGVTNARQEIAAEKAQIKKLNKEIKALQEQKVAVTDGRIVDAKKEIEERKKKIEQINRDIASVRIMNAGAYIGVMPDILDAFSRLNAQVESLLMGGRVDLADFRAKREAHKRELVNMVLEALDNPEALDRNKPEYTAWQKAKDTGFVRFFTTHLGSLDNMLRNIDRNAPNGEGMVHTYFTTKLADAKDAIYENSVKDVDILDSKAQALFGTTFGRAMRKAERKVLGTMTMTRTKEDGTQITEEYEMTVATALYTMMMWNQPASRPALENMGATEEDIEQLRTWLNANNPAWLQFAGWVVNDFLPSNRARYNEVYRAMNGTDMDFAENYFPIRRMSTAIPKEVDLADPSFENKPSTVTGAIMKRTENKLPIDLETSFFGALQDNIVEMEEWSAFAPIISDFNAILSSPAVKKAMGDMGKYFHNDFQQAAKVATLKYAGDAKKLDGVFWQMVYRTWASTKLAFKAFTALKQLASSVLFLPYSGDLKFIGRLLHYYLGGKGKLSDAVYEKFGDGSLTNREEGQAWLNINWALENSSMFRRRWESGVAGNDIFTRELKYDSRTKAGRFMRSISEAVDWLQKKGMAPIALIDAYTVSAGMRAIYEYELANLTQKEGYTKEEAKKIAMRRAEMIANKSQQSSEGEYLAPLQMERGFITSLTMFQNAPFAQGRNIAEAWTEITRNTDKEYAFIKKQEIARMKKARAAEYEAIEATIAMEKELGIITNKEQESLRRERLQRPINAEIEAQAHTATKTKIVRAKMRASRTLLYNAFLGQFVFNLMGKAPYLLFGDDDEEKKKAWKELGWLTAFAPVSTITAGGTLMSILGGHKVSFSGALSEFEEEWNKIISEYKNDGFFEAMLAAGDFLIRKGFGVDYETFMRMYAGIENMFESGMSAENIFMALNAPDSQVRLLAGDRKEGETAQEYATRIMRLYSIFSNPEYSDYYNEKFSYRGENPAFLMSDYMARGMKKSWEMAYRSDVMRNKGLPGEWSELQDTEEEYEEVVEALGFKANKTPADEAGYIDGEYRAPIEGLSEDDFDDLKYLAEYVAEVAKDARTYLGGDEDTYLECVRDEMDAKRELISEYNKILNK